MIKTGNELFNSKEEEIQEEHFVLEMLHQGAGIKENDNLQNLSLYNPTSANTLSKI